MPTYRITAPDGTKYRVSGEGTAEEALQHFQDNYTVNRNENYSNEGRAHPLTNPDADSGTLSRFAAGVSGATDTLRSDLNAAIKKVLPSNPDRQSIFGGPAMQPPADPEMDASLQQSRNRSALYEQSKDQLGTAGAVGDVVPELALSSVPIARAGTAVAKAPLLVKTLGRLAPAAGDIAANAAYSGTKAAAQGKDAGDIAADAALGGAGAAGGRVLVRALAGSKPLISDAARTLVDRNVLPTPGQLFGDGIVGSTIRSAEDKATSIPLVGDVINYARRRGLNDFNRATISDVVDHLPGRPVTSTGIDAVEQAQGKVSSAYDAALDGMQVKPEDVSQALQATHLSMRDDIALLDDAQKAKVGQFIKQRIAPEIARTGTIDGQSAKAIDSEMGHWARQFSRSQNPGDRPLGEAFYELQTNWREAMAHGSSPENTSLLNAANNAHRELLPIVKAADKAAAQGGVFTPNQLQRAGQQFRQDPTELTQAAQSVLPSRVPDSGTAGRLLIGGGAGALAHAFGAPIIAPATVMAVLYSRPGMHLFLNGVGGLLPAQTKAYMAGLAPDAAVRYLGEITQKFPHIREGVANAVQQTAAQAGRMAATQQQPEMAP